MRERAATVNGLAESTMSHDDGWRFLVLGRSLERVDMTARLLATRALAADHAPSWTTLLRACGADETFLRTYRGALDADHVAEFLLLDRLFPRSVFAALVEAERCLLALEPDIARAGVGDPSRRIVGRVRDRVSSTSTPRCSWPSCRRTSSGSRRRASRRPLLSPPGTSSTPRRWPGYHEEV